MLLGLTQVLSRNWLSHANLSVDHFSGYLNDPYRIISVLDVAGNVNGYRYESRPGARTRRSAYLENRVGGEWTSAALALRYMTDSWGIRSDTAQLRLRLWAPSRDQYFEPSVRWYRQTAADFYTPWVPALTGPSPYESADSRLAAFHALTFGVKYGNRMGQRLGRFGRDTTELNIRLEYYQQTQSAGPRAPAALQGLDLYPKLKAVLVQFGFSY